MTGSCGPCRFGYYSVLEDNILKNLGYDVEFIVFDPIGGEGWKPLRDNLLRTFKVSKTKDLILAGKLGWELIKKSGLYNRII